MDSLHEALWRAAANRRARLPRTSGLPAADVDAAVGEVLRRALERVWEHGWMPHDVYEAVRRDADERALSFLVDAVAADTARHTALHPRWRAQVDGIGAEVWWDTGEPHLEQWARRHIELREDAVAAAVAVLGVLISLPDLPVIVPRPGTPMAAFDHRGVDPKVLNRVRGLLAKAESTAFPEEAEALSAKAQELVTRHALERMPVEAASTTSRRLWLDRKYFDGKAQVVHVVARANRCRAVVYDLGFVALVGEELDLEIVELLSASLLVQATRAMVAAGDGARKGDEARSAAYRKSFLLSYAHRVGERLEAANAVPEDDRLLPVLAERRKAVDEYFGAMFTRTVAKTTPVRSAAGWDAGRSAADRANLSVG
ncbi:DUF2786 domain-containing protein [Saccharothrix longispora]|uniref:DUF2786 domain-containing protein n=1 Tax=Saccharothrix longispora TaxID=33920 RepID=UPI0028FD239F|nr:DUF2786 domain-containing protein [Saccharothrix longispora]MBY8850403.1 DUF2786 domain-containing protein [Saccharothrix sp. MB29]MDU0291202.1 DUF2786 domain-containing protein [Saccharothrix longispora]